MLVASRAQSVLGRHLPRSGSNDVPACAHGVMTGAPDSPEQGSFLFVLESVERPSAPQGLGCARAANRLAPSTPSDHLPGRPTAPRWPWATRQWRDVSNRGRHGQWKLCKPMWARRVQWHFCGASRCRPRPRHDCTTKLSQRSRPQSHSHWEAVACCPSHCFGTQLSTQAISRNTCNNVSKRDALSPSCKRRGGHATGGGAGTGSAPSGSGRSRVCPAMAARSALPAEVRTHGRSPTRSARRNIHACGALGADRITHERRGWPRMY